MEPISSTTLRGSFFVPALVGFIVGTLGGLIGLGGAEFRLPILISLFSFVALEAVILNKAISLVVVASAFVFRGLAVPFAEVFEQWPIMVNILAGSLIGAWLAADVATRLRARTLYRIIAVLLALIAIVLFASHDPSQAHAVASGATLIVMGFVAGTIIGAIAALLGVAGGEFLIPTLVLLYGVDVKLAGSLSLAISLPTMLVGLARYSRDRSFAVLGTSRSLFLMMAAGSVLGTLAGARLLAYVSSAFLVPLLVLILLVSALKVWRHR